MKTNRQEKRGINAFTLIEMIGVLAVIAILASLLIPKIFEAINNARINNAALSYNTVKSATADHYAKYGSLLSSNGVTIIAGTGEATNFDKVLLTEGFLDKPFSVKISGIPSNYVQVVAAVAAATAPDAVNSAFDLDGNAGANPNDAVGTAVAEAVIESVSAADAKDLNDRLDGPALGAALNAPDLIGRVKFPAPASAGAPVTVRIYVTHR
jgi:prepilin-type N-terminal cleavage/methylation domain-containing protein